MALRPAVRGARLVARTLGDRGGALHDGLSVVHVRVADIRPAIVSKRQVQRLRAVPGLAATDEPAPRAGVVSGRRFPAQVEAPRREGAHAAGSQRLAGPTRPYGLFHALGLPALHSRLA